jgi:signal transduction histidine kinase
MEQEVRHLRVSEEIGKIADLIKSVAGAKDIRVDLEIEERLMVSADRNMFRTIVLNLLSNAVKFTPEAGKVALVAVRDNHLAVFRVSDTGTGMTPGELDQLFRIDTSCSREGTAGEKGSGLGLLVCKEMLDLNGGSIEVQSQEGVGSTFVFTLPAV